MSPPSNTPSSPRIRAAYVATFVAAAGLTVGVLALWRNIMTRKAEALNHARARPASATPEVLKTATR